MGGVVAILALMLWATPGWGAEEPAPAEGGEQRALLERLHTIHLLSEALVERAASGRAPAQSFQIDARLYREQLRQVMLANRELAATEQLPQPLLMSMVRMSALLHAAADCKSGLVITCPPDLMHQLRAQLAAVDTALPPAERDSS